MQPESRKWYFIVNPTAGGGKGGDRWRKLLPKIKARLPDMEVGISTSAEGLSNLVYLALKAGETQLVGVGGDGTHHAILNALVNFGQLHRILYAPLSLGSGNDWIRSLGTPTSIDSWLTYLKHGVARQHRIGRLQFQDTGESSYFLNVAGLAYDAQVVRVAEGRPLRHRWMYPLLTFSQLFKYSAPEVLIRFNNSSYQGQVHTINLGIGRFSGGGMSLVPHADPFANTLALTIAERLPIWKILLHGWRFYTGSIAKVSGVITVHAKSVEIKVISGVLEAEADGEYLGRGPVTISIFDQSLNVLTLP